MVSYSIIASSFVSNTSEDVFDFDDFKKAIGYLTNPFTKNSPDAEHKWVDYIGLYVIILLDGALCFCLNLFWLAIVCLVLVILLTVGACLRIYKIRFRSLFKAIGNNFYNEKQHGYSDNNGDGKYTTVKHCRQNSVKTVSICDYVGSSSYVTYIKY